MILDFDDLGDVVGFETLDASTRLTDRWQIDGQPERDPAPGNTHH